MCKGPSKWAARALGSGDNCWVNEESTQMTASRLKLISKKAGLLCMGRRSMLQFQSTRLEDRCKRKQGMCLPRKALWNSKKWTKVTQSFKEFSNPTVEKFIWPMAVYSDSVPRTLGYARNMAVTKTYSKGDVWQKEKEKKKDVSLDNSVELLLIL